MGSISADDLTWNDTKELSETELSQSELTASIDQAPDSEYLLVMRSSAAKNYSGSVKTGDFWMQGQGDLDFNITSAQTTSRVFGPFESGRFMQSDSTFKVSFSSTVTMSNIVATLLEAPK